jgi:hypothetical protein
MIREPDFDQTLRAWMDAGADQAPERFVWEALEKVERTAQRGAWSASLEGLLMKIKPVAPLFGVAAAVVLAIVAYAVFGGGNVGGPSDPTPSPTPRIHAIEDLPNIVATFGSEPEGMIVDGTTLDVAALTTPLREGGAEFDRSTFVDAHMSNLNTTDEGGFVSWAALFETVTDADAAFDLLVAEHDSAEGWDMEPFDELPALGDERVAYQGAAYNFDTALVHLWRDGNLLLAAVSVGDVAVTDADVQRLEALALWMDERAE